MRAFLGEIHQQRFSVSYIWLGDEQDGFVVEDFATHYDTRLYQPGRSPEWRLYYSSNAVTEAMREGDTLFLAKRPGDELLFIVVPAESTIESQLKWLFGIDAQPNFAFASQVIVGDADHSLDFASRFILDELGIEFEDPDANSLDSIIEAFGLVFPKTQDFSTRARLTLPHIDARDDPDEALMAWLDHEEAMFRRLERRVISERLEQGFKGAEGIDVDGFLSFSLSVQNRRKSRAGQALENHLEAIFTAHGLRFARGKETENRNKPDFLFPGQDEYLAPEFPPSKLAMLGAKSTLKDRWRQVLSEAERIPQKHLLTLEPGISENQTTEMIAKSLQLVLPRSLHRTFTPGQQGWLMNLGDFIHLVAELQR